ncbi:MAG: calcium/sodium antiporter [Gammaproteobacteria bacterium]|nr:calcium/sodium antiporter [Gammaproteobacteria bacterium]MCP4088584.1 calcium/sodium antiporter [Gammaproteobacteria bacterium]MCP4276508.1 calcium/sodium antiporter [Gammaproteobacteria bacterium]MCP4832385.1 calcium/sodium antiporter [Gammaproteobacteria bacterium]MCP4929101.1 calcium/sodium antiporter [Gammaproteobacteria bacterium]
MLLDLIYIVIGFGLLIWGADRFVIGASSTASILGVPPLLIGLTVVGFATSAPEILVSVSAATQGLSGIAVGNALGSNIANIGLVLGLTALIAPINATHSATLRKEISLLILLTLATMLLFLDNSLDRLDGLILIGGLIIFLGWVTRTGMRLSTSDPLASELTQELTSELPTQLSWKTAGLWLILGLTTLLIGANLLVAGAENLAVRMGISELVIGLTIVAVGTSLPELAVSVISALKGETGIAIGNIIGSNVFNLLAVVGVAGLIHPIQLDPSVLTLHYPVMAVFTLVLLRLAYNPFGTAGLGRITGFCLLAAFFAYQTTLLTGNL